MASPHGFSVPSLEKKLKELNTTLQSIQGLSQWAIHHRKHAKTIISVWYKELQKGEVSADWTDSHTDDGCLLECCLTLASAV